VVLYDDLGVWRYEVEKDGKTVALDKRGTIDAIKLMVAMWKDAYDEGGLSWDDASNNRAFLRRASRSPATLPASTSWPARSSGSREEDEPRPDPRGPAGRFYHMATQQSC